MERNRIYLGDCIEGMRSLPNESVDLIATDPPYRLTQRGTSGTMSGYWTSDLTKRGKVFDHNDTDISDYLPEFYRVLKEGTHCYIMCNNFNLPHFFDVIGKSDFHFTRLLVWDKRNKICGRYYMSQCEFIFMLRKGKDRPINECGCSDILPVPNIKTKGKDGNVHDSEKPVALMGVLVRNSTERGDLVLDPFMGSGTTAAACVATGRDYIGWEMDEKYHSYAVNRLRNLVKQKDLFE